jgi:hypothetical protein
MRLLLAALPSLLSIGFVAYRVLLVPVNHTGFTPHYLDAFSIASIQLALALKLERRALWGIVVLAAVNTCLVIWAINSHNFLEYEDWIRRGMPEKTVGAGAALPASAAIAPAP